MILLPLLIFLQPVATYRILGVFPIAAGSHYIITSKLMKGLAEAGHNVTVISPYRFTATIKNGSYTDITLEEFAQDYLEVLKTDVFLKASNDNIYVLLRKLVIFWGDLANKTLHHPKVTALLKSNVKFDAVITENFFNEAFKIYAYIYNCSLINIISTGPNAWINPVVGNPQPKAYLPHFYLTNNYTNGLNFFHRINNLFHFIAEYICHLSYYMPNQDEILHSVFPHAPNIWRLRNTVSMVLLNSHTSIYYPMPLVPNMVEIGGYHIDPPQKLPQDLQKFLDEATEGAILFSMGSNIRDIAEDRKNMMLRVFGRLRQRVLWKMENTTVDLPENVYVKSWLQQQDILGHANIRLFITHAGLLSILETIYHAVPILAIPVFADQPMNAQRAVQSGFGLQLNYHDDTNFNEETFSSLIQELLSNPKYKTNAQKLSKIFHDRPIKPMANAVYWVEYAIRNFGVEQLRVDAINMSWITYYMFDVILLLLLVVFINIKLLFKAIRVIRKSK